MLELYRALSGIAIVIALIELLLLGHFMALADRPPQLICPPPDSAPTIYTKA